MGDVVAMMLMMTKIAGGCMFCSLAVVPMLSRYIIDYRVKFAHYVTIMKTFYHVSRPSIWVVRHHSQCFSTLAVQIWISIV